MKLGEIEHFFVFDVESIGLHGEGFSVGWVVLDAKGGVVAEACYSCHPDEAVGDDSDREWVKKNVPEPHNGYNCRMPSHVRHSFWEAWSYARERKGVLVADCGWPVEARFLATCVDDAPSTRKWTGPYPLHDLASIVLAFEGDPIATTERLPSELPEHNALADARQSARVLRELLLVKKDS